MRWYLLKFAALLGCLALFPAGATAQSKKTRKANQRETAAPAATKPAVETLPTQRTAAYSYEFKQPEFLIQRIFIETDDQGKGQITFERRLEGDALTDPLTFSAAAWARVTALWAELNFLDATENYQSERQYPHLGTMWLRMKKDGRERTAEFNWTSNKTVEALVNEYRRAADQAQFVFEITLARENYPLNAPKLMETLEKLYERNSLSDPQQLAPLLRELSDDERIPRMARTRAAKVLAAIEKEKKQ
jgi:hypothetical protein